MNKEEAKKIIDNMSEQELNDFIFFALQEVEKENQKLKTELRNKDKEIQFQKEINKTKQDRPKQTEKSLKGQLEKKDKQIEQYQNMLATNDMLHVIDCEKKDEWINKLETKLMYALTPIKYELAKRTQEEFKETIRENIDEDTYTIKRKLKENWNNL